MSIDSIFAKANWLNAEEYQDYGADVIPNLRDDRISLLLRSWISLNNADREKAENFINSDQRGILLAYSERMASRAVRESDGQWVFLGLVAQGLDGFLPDWRENTILLSLHYDACQRIRIGPEVLFSEAGRFLVRNVRESMIDFLRRAPEDKSLASMGYMASSEGAEFRYIRNW